jgi:aspartyl-tRNA(Asn)/glutamyl-tRNA(Gln) amidotransferase subunit B
MTPYKVIVGLEVHVELGTKTKMFCRCLNDPFGTEPNTNVCPVCLGLPGTLPVPNRDAVRRTILVGKALGSTISEHSKFDRKHYFYPDNPKGYQISQFDLPLCVGGSVELLAADGSVESTVRFERVHLEEDAGKLVHAGKGVSHVDLNRAGVPLMEMVSKPDITSAEQARRFLREIQLLVRTLGIADADMEKGQMRCDVNINVVFEHEGKAVRTPITEVKNVNSTRAVERSIQTEAQRQYDEWMANGPIRTRQFKLTAGWDEDSNEVTIQRAKEGSADYRYFPEPDIPPMAVYELDDLNPNAMELPELPNVTRRRMLESGVAFADVELLLSDRAKLIRSRELVTAGMPPKDAAKWITNAPESDALSAVRLIELDSLIASGDASFSAVKPKVVEFAAAEPVRAIAERLGLLQAHDDSVVQLAIRETIEANPNALADFKSGNERILGFFVGQVMKKAAGKAQPAKVQEAVRHALEQA